MIRELVKLRGRNQITLPAEVAERLSVKPGALLELILDPNDDHIQLRHAQVVRAGTPRARKEEQAALNDIRQGRFSTFANPEEMARDLKASRAKEELQERIDALQQQMDGLMQCVKNLSETPADAEATTEAECQPAITERARIQTG